MDLNDTNIHLTKVSSLVSDILKYYKKCEMVLIIQLILYSSGGMEIVSDIITLLLSVLTKSTRILDPSVCLIKLNLNGRNASCTIEII